MRDEKGLSGFGTSLGGSPERANGSVTTIVSFVADSSNGGISTRVRRRRRRR